MLTAILGILSSSGVGSIIGLLGGLANRWLDQKSKVQDQAHELKKLEAEREFMKAEYASRLEIATREGATQLAVAAEGVEVAGYEALAQSYKFAVPKASDGWVDTASKAIRPILTLAFFIFTVYIFAQLAGLVKELDVALPPERVLELYEYAIQWIFFQSGAAIGWWFAMRPGRMPQFRSR